MGERGPTDVLSFPSGSDAVLGDIALSWDAVRRQARGSSDGAHMNEATLLSVHGLVHLMGHDHRTSRESRVMLRLEQRALRALRVPDVARPYAP